MPPSPMLLAHPVPGPCVHHPAHISKHRRHGVVRAQTDTHTGRRHGSRATTADADAGRKTQPSMQPAGGLPPGLLCRCSPASAVCLRAGDPLPQSR